MALTPFQRAVCRLLAERRVASGESYVAGGGALGEATQSGRISQDIDLFHDTTQAVAVCWAHDRELLESQRHVVRVLRERPSFVEAIVSKDDASVLVQWAADSAYRFYPLVAHPEFGLTLSPFDLATNKVLALIGRVEARDWIDVIASHASIQALGYLAWAACGKDPGFSPTSILEQAARTARYSEDEIAALAFEGPAPSASELSITWHAMLDEARAIVATLPPHRAGTCVLDADGTPFRGSLTDLSKAIAADALQFRSGSVRGVLPTVRPASAHRL